MAGPGDGAAGGAGGVRLDRRPHRRVRRRPRARKSPSPTAIRRSSSTTRWPNTCRSTTAKLGPVAVRRTRRRRLDGRSTARSRRSAPRGARVLLIEAPGSAAYRRDARPPGRAAGGRHLLGERQKDDLFRRNDGSTAGRRPRSASARRTTAIRAIASSWRSSRRCSPATSGSASAWRCSSGRIQKDDRSLFPRRNRRRRRS